MTLDVWWPPRLTLVGLISGLALVMARTRGLDRFPLQPLPAVMEMGVVVVAMHLGSREVNLMGDLVLMLVVKKFGSLELRLCRRKVGR